MKSLKTTLSAPIFTALIIQSAALIASIVLIECFSVLIRNAVAPYWLPCLQGFAAWGISRWRGMAPWWLIIQLFFPISVFFALSLHLPPIIFLVAFIFMMALYWTTFQTQVPFYPSNPATWKAVAELLPQKPGLKFIDIGSGLGGLVLHLDKHYADYDFDGIEVAPLPWLISWLRAFIGRRRCRFLRGNYNQLNFSHYDVVFAYLSPAVMSAVWEKARAEMRPETLFISYEFPIAARDPDNTIRPSAQTAELYCWRMN